MGLRVLGLFNTSPADYGQLRLTTGGCPEYVPKWSAGSEGVRVGAVEGQRPSPREVTGRSVDGWLAPTSLNPRLDVGR